VVEQLHFEGFVSEYQSPQLKSPREVCLAEVAACDIFILVVGERYGFIPEADAAPGSPYDGKVSVTQGEFLKARELRKPILVFVKYLAPGAREPRQEAFLSALNDFLQGQFLAEFASVEDFRSKLFDAVSGLLVDLVRHNYVTPWKKRPCVIITESRDEVARVAARILGHAIQSRPNANIGLSAGRTASEIFFRFFQEFDAAQMKNIVHSSFFSVTEHFGISPRNPNSYYHWFHQAFFNKVADTWQLVIPEEHKKLVPSVIERDSIEGFRIEYDQFLQIHKVDVQLMTPAPTGQIICVDPYTYPLAEMLDMGTTLTRYCKETSGYLVPVSPHDLDMVIGIRNILHRSDHLVVPVYGANKRDVVRRMILGPVGEDCPASLLSHFPREKNLLFIFDRECAEGLPDEIERHVNLLNPDDWKCVW
jgi:6-phosphogluconolactonase/glucosamine-6-phosphate isomerase/deaminase